MDFNQIKAKGSDLFGQAMEKAGPLAAQAKEKAGPLAEKICGPCCRLVHSTTCCRLPRPGGQSTRRHRSTGDFGENCAQPIQ